MGIRSHIASTYLQARIVCEIRRWYNCEEDIMKQRKILERIRLAYVHGVDVVGHQVGGVGGTYIHHRSDAVEGARKAQTSKEATPGHVKKLI
jgi:hypothetical protein